MASSDQEPEPLDGKNDQSTTSEALSAIIDKCRADNIPFELQDATLLDKQLVISMPNGRVRRELVAREDGPLTVLLQEIDFGRYIYVGDYEAIASYEDGYIEAQVSDLGVPPSSRFALRRLSVMLRPDDSPPAGETGRYSQRDLPTVQFSSDGVAWRAEISPATRSFIALSSNNRFLRDLDDISRPRSATLKIVGVDISTHDDAHRVLEVISNSLFFELDLRHGIPFRIAKYRSRRLLPGLGRRHAPQRSTELPRAKYAVEPLALYWYGRSASGMPLLQFLAYYQVLEFYFPVYSRAEALRRVRQELRDPRFNIDDDSNLGRIVDIASRSASGFGSERDYLKATLRACLDESSLRELLTGSPEVEEHFTRRSQIHGVPVLNLHDKQSDLRDQLAQRVYNLRCRIVHTKDADTTADTGLLLPNSREAEALTFDIALLRTVAQEVLISGASTLYIRAGGGPS